VIAGRLRGCAELLEEQGDDGFRSRAYRRAADFVAALVIDDDSDAFHDFRSGTVS
jgi:DNA polymerase/3'-5' exonuclease PolX